MNKKEKEKCLFEIKIKEIEAYDRDSTPFINKLLFGLGSVLAFFYVNKLLNMNFFYVLIFIFVLISILSITTYHHISDCYDSLFDSVKKDKIFYYKIPEFKWYDFFYYKRKFKLYSYIHKKIGRRGREFHPNFS